MAAFNFQVNWQDSVSPVNGTLFINNTNWDCRFVSTSEIAALKDPNGGWANLLCANGCNCYGFQWVNTSGGWITLWSKGDYLTGSTPYFFSGTETGTASGKITHPSQLNP